MKMGRQGTSYGQKGEALVEMAFIMIVFLFLTFGITEFARALYTYNTIVQMTRKAARWAVVNVASNADTTNIDRTKNIVVYGLPDVPPPPDPFSNPLLNGLTTGNVNVQVQTIESEPSGRAICQKISVTVSGYQFRFVVPIVLNIPIPPFETSLYTESMGSTG